MAAAHEILAVALQQQGNLLMVQKKTDQAIDCYQHVLALKPDMIEAQYNLGNALMSRGRFEEAVVAYRAAIALLPTLAVAQTNLGHALSHLGRLDESAQCFRRTLVLQPDCALAFSNLGNVLKAQAKLDAAIDCYRRALELAPDQLESHNNLGNAWHLRGNLDAAVASFRRALELVPDNPVTLYNLGTVLQQQCQWDEALACYRRAIELNPGFAEAHCNLGDAMKRQGHLNEALLSCCRALELKPDYFDACANLADIFLHQRKLADAIQFSQRAIELRPNSAEAHCSLGNAFREQGQLGLAIDCYLRALQADPQSAAAHCNLGVAYLNQGKVDDAIASFRRALQLSPDYALAHSNLLFSLQYADGITLAALSEAHEEFDRLHAAPLRRNSATISIVQDHGLPLRVGFVSSDLGRHPMGYFLASVVEHLPSGQFTSICYSDRMRKDDFTERIQSGVSVWRDVAHLSDGQLAEQIQADKIDILFDLSGHTARNRLRVFARKPAAIQVTWAGYVGTTGLKTMDYILADRYEIPVAAERYYQERVLRMPDGYVCYVPPDYAPPVQALPALARGGMTFGCFNNPAKITRKMIDVWAAILQRLPESRLILKYRGWNDETVVRQFVEQIRGLVDPKRITFLGQSSHVELLSEYNRIDLALDPSPYSGGLTTCEALWMGVPVISCPGETFASRHSLSHLSNVGLTETIANNLDEYLNLAVSLATDLSRLAALRTGLRERMAMSPLCDGKRFADNLAILLHEIWNKAVSESAQNYSARFGRGVAC